MAMRKIVVVGDTTTTGGVILPNTNSTFSVGDAGHKVALIGGRAKTLMDQDTASGTTKGIGHFYFRPDSKEGRDRRTALAKYLYDQGLR